MATLEPRRSRRSAARALSRACLAGLIGILAAGPVTAPVWATTSGAAAPPPATGTALGPDVVVPAAGLGDIPGVAGIPAVATTPDPGTTPEPEPTSSNPPPPPPPPDPAPSHPPDGKPTVAPPPRPNPKPTAAPPVSPPRRPRLGVRVTTGDVVLPGSYWNSRGAVADLAITVANTGEVTERVHLTYVLPAGLRDAGTAGCWLVTAGTSRCTARTVEAGATWTLRARVRVTADAWRLMPLNGMATARAQVPTRPLLGSARDREGFAVLFPPGPPSAGVALAAGEVRFDPAADGNATLEVKLGNTGRIDATGSVEIILPDGIDVVAVPPGCRLADSGRTRCAFGLLPAGRSAGVRLTARATPQVLARAPLSGAVLGTLKPTTGKTRQARMSFRILLASGPGAAPTLDQPALAASPAAGARPSTAAPELTSAKTPAAQGELNTVAIIGLIVAVVALALALAIVSLRSRLR